MSPALVLWVMDQGESNVPHPFLVVRDTPFPMPPGRVRPTNIAARADRPPYDRLMRDPRSPGIVRECGDALRKELYAHPHARTTLEQLPIEPGIQRPIFLRVDSLEAENLPWEALWQQGTYFALTPTWPIARLSQSTQSGVPAARAIEPELKVLAVLAAAGRTLGIDARTEWNGLWNALAPLGSRLRVHAITCQETLADQIRALNQPHVTCEIIESVDTISLAVQRFGPNIIHFFCHGVGGLDPKLQLATPADYDASAEDGREGSILISRDRLAGLAVAESVWLITLNCCQGARASASVQSIAAQVAERGVPAVVAMRENVVYAAAHRFAGELYRHLVAMVEPLLPSKEEASAGKSSNAPATLWLDAMHRARDSLSRQQGGPPDDYAEWTLPVLYVQPEGVAFRARPRTGLAEAVSTAISAGGTDELAEKDKTPSVAALRTQLRSLKGMRLQFAAAGAPASVLASMDQEITATRRDLAEKERATLTNARDALLALGNVDLAVLAAIEDELAELQKRRNAEP